MGVAPWEQSGSRKVKGAWQSTLIARSHMLRGDSGFLCLGLVS